MSDLPVSAKVNVEVEGRSTDKLIDAVVDVFSPATEVLGALGDSVRLARVEIAAKITRRAKEIADAEGFNLTAPPVKFMVPFYERASLEEDEEIAEIWARLLVAASSQHSHAHNYLIDVLTKLDHDHAALFKQITEHGASPLVHLVDVPIFYQRWGIESTIKSVFREGRLADEIGDDLLDIFSAVGVLPLMIGFDFIGDYYECKLPKFENVSEYHAQLLVALGLCRQELYSIEIANGRLDLNYIYITDLGYELWQTINTAPKD